MVYRYSKKQIRRRDAIFGGLLLLILLVLIITFFFISLMDASSASNITSDFLTVCYTQDTHEICL